MKAMTRQQLALAAGVTPKTLRNWCRPHEQELRQMGMEPGSKVLPPNVVEWLCRRFCIDV